MLPTKRVPGPGSRPKRCYNRLGFGWGALGQVMQLRTWLRPGMWVKRWIMLLFAGMVMTSLALAMALSWVYKHYPVPAELSWVVRAVTLQFIAHPFRELIVLGFGAGSLVIGLVMLARSILAPFLIERPDGRRLAEIIHQHRFGEQEPQLRIVAVGGGTGLSTLLRGLKQHPVDITAIVTVGDDGGSSGRLRSEFNMLPPGDIRNCLLALADVEPLMGELFQYRFNGGSSLEGHSFGNLFITALTQVTGSFEKAIVESSRVLNVRGQVLPSTLEDIVVCGEMTDGRVIRGESNITETHATIQRIFLDPANPPAYDPAIVALLSADLIVLGPGSLYTSVLPNLLVPGIEHALRCSPARKVYVCNVATQHGETDNFGVVEHVEALLRHVDGPVVDCVLANAKVQAVASQIRPGMQVSAVDADGLERLDGIDVLLRDVISDEKPLRHDPGKLADELLEVARAGSPRGAQTTVTPEPAGTAPMPVTAGFRLPGQPHQKEGL